MQVGIDKNVADAKIGAAHEEYKRRYELIKKQYPKKNDENLFLRKLLQLKLCARYEDKLGLVPWVAYSKLDAASDLLLRIRDYNYKRDKIEPYRKTLEQIIKDGKEMLKGDDKWGDFVFLKTLAFDYPLDNDKPLEVLSEEFEACRRIKSKHFTRLGTLALFIAKKYELSGDIEKEIEYRRISIDYFLKKDVNRVNPKNKINAQIVADRIKEHRGKIYPTKDAELESIADEIYYRKVALEYNLKEDVERKSFRNKISAQIIADRISEYRKKADLSESDELESIADEIYYRKIALEYSLNEESEGRDSYTVKNAEAVYDLYLELGGREKAVEFLEEYGDLMGQSGGRDQAIAVAQNIQKKNTTENGR